MGNKKPSDGLISARDLPPLKAWAFPQVAGAHVVRSPFNDQKVSAEAASPASVPVSSGPLTVAEVKQLREKASKEGRAQGLAEGRKLGQEEGLEAGHAEGYKTAYARAEAEINATKARLMQLLDAMQRPLEQQQEGLEQALLRLVIDTAEAVTKQELATRPELLRQAVKESLDALPQYAQQLCFFVHADDEALLQELRAQERASWEVAVDAALSQGGIRVRGECSYLDYSVERRFSQVVQQVLTETAKQQPPAEGSDEVAG